MEALGDLEAVFFAWTPLTLLDPVPNRVMVDEDARMVAALGNSWDRVKSVPVYHGHSKSSTSF